MLYSLTGYLKKLALALWIGAQGFFVLGVAPSVFRTLDRPVAAKLMAEIFPRYFAMGSICGLVILFVLLVERFNAKRQGLLLKFKFIPLALNLLALSCFAYCYFILLPQILEAQAAIFNPTESGLPAATSSSEFQQLHSQSTRLNGIALVALLVLLFFV